MNPIVSRQAFFVRLFLSLFVFLTLALHALPARSTLLEITPTLNPDGSVVNVLIGVSGLGEQAPPSLATFDLDLFYSPRVLTLTSVSFLHFLGDPNTFLYICPHCELGGSGLMAIPTYPSGTQATTSAFQRGFPVFPIPVVPSSLSLGLFETSLLGIALDGAQPSDFPLVSIDFSVRARGVSELGIFINQFNDIAGDPILVNNATDVLGRSFVRGPSVRVPEPSTILLMIIPLVCLTLVRAIPGTIFPLHSPLQKLSVNHCGGAMKMAS